MRNVSRKFAPQCLALLPLCHIHEDHDCTRHTAAGNDRIGEQLPCAAAEGKFLISARSVQRSVNQRQKFAGANHLMQVFRLLCAVYPQ